MSIWKFISYHISYFQNVSALQQRILELKIQKDISERHCDELRIMLKNTRLEMHSRGRNALLLPWSFSSSFNFMSNDFSFHIALGLSLF